MATVDALLLVLGALVGAVSTGGVQAWERRNERLLRRKVAARVILGDLYVLEALCELVEKISRWPDRLDLDAPLATWREQRVAFAPAVEAWEWALVDGLFSNLHRTSLMVRKGDACTSSDLEVVADIRRAVVPARDIVLRHATTEEERAKVVEQLSASSRRASGAPS